MSPRRASALSLIFLVVSCAGPGLPEQPVLKDFAVPQTDYALGSGLRVLVQTNHNSPLVVVTSVFDVGATSDPPGREGLAHLIEHLVFRSRPEGGQHAFWDLLQRTGASFNASTSPDLTTYYATAHRDRVAELLQLEGWRLASTLDGVTEEAFQIEREVVQNELRQRRETTVGNRIFDELLARLFPKGHPLSRPTAGTHESLAAITLDDARRFVASHYRPERCTIVIAGDVNAEQVRAQLGRWPAELLFAPGGPSAPKVPHPLLAQTFSPPPQPPVSTALGHLKGPVSEPLLLLAWSLPGGLRGNDAIAEFTATSMLVSLRTGVLAEVNDELVGFSTDAVPLADGSLIIVTAQLRAGANPERVRTRVLDAVGGARTVVSNLPLVRSRAWAAGTAVLRSSADPVTNGQAVAQFLATTGVTSYYATTLRELARLTPSSVAFFADKYLDRDRAVSVVFEPEDRATASRPSSAGAPAGDHLRFDDQMNLVGLGAAEIRRVAHSPGLAQLPRFKLANGLEVVTISRPTLPVAEIHLQIPGGDATAWPYGLATMAARMSRPCSPERGGTSLNHVGGSLGESHGALASRFTVEVMSGNLTNGLAVLANTVSCRHLEDTGSEWQSQQMKERAQRQRERDTRPQVRAVKTLWSALYPGHPYAQVEADSQALTETSHGDLVAQLTRHFRPDGGVAVVITDAGAGTVRRLVEDYYTSWSGGGAHGPRPPAAPAAPAARAIHLFNRPGATQSTLFLGCRVGPVTSELLPTFDLLSSIVTQQAWELREAWGATYGIHARVEERPGAAHLLLEGAVETGRTGAAVQKLLDLVAGLATAGPDMRTFTLKRWDLARGFDLGLATPTAMARAIFRAQLNGWPLDTWDQYPERLATAGRADVRAAIAPCAGHEVLTVVGDAATVRPQLERLGLAVR